MTEKRFELSLGEDTDGYIIDKIKHKSYFLRSDDVKKEITEILNQFYNENEDLKTDISVLNRHYDEYGKICAKLKDENEQLKKQREELFIRERDTKNDWRELRRENEQFKKALRVAYSTNLTKPSKNTIEQIAKYCGVDLE